MSIRTKIVTEGTLTITEAQLKRIALSMFREGYKRGAVQGKDEDGYMSDGEYEALRRQQNVSQRLKTVYRQLRDTSVTPQRRAV
jgi:50S ribosomal subunit-associated GTPase HflX